MVYLITFAYERKTPSQAEKGRLTRQHLIHVLESLGSVLKLTTNTWLLSTSMNSEDVSEAMDGIGNAMLTWDDRVLYRLVILKIDKSQMSCVAGAVEDNERENISEWIRRHINHK